ncbi:metal-dependent hydrolase [Sulfurimonas sp.]|jgi:cytosine/adenosine deaminase-related metal-dependent hydrolase|uniref:aminofutalosine deaminase family hydrolase n=1 Tax=Sulfurimonas sp. TaxID=2022749 RepID=UPI002A366E39|nr:metal-dependent hydrolase [Sulfurimonas sp.]MDY0124031.1 metal-dependent hydrolase [Sulfurimonas sp.]
MQIITPDYILTPDMLLCGMSVAFEKTIKKIAPIEELKKEFGDADIINLKKNSLLMPGLINAHVHIEFSANKTQLSYGDFIPWLYSVIENRDELINGCDDTCMAKAVNSMLESGITTFGAISSHGMDLNVCAKAPQNVVFFNELIGSQATMADALFGDFIARLDASKSVKREGFYPAVAIHSPYSVHPALIKKALGLVKDENLKLTAHFMESSAEREWLDKSEGDFKDFFENLLKQSSSISDPSEFLEYFSGYGTLLTHVVKANEEELKTLSSNGHTVIHCPISNRLLGNGALDLKRLQNHNIRWICATDGLSSNYKLDLFEEMKCALFMHSNMPLLELAKSLIKSVTKDAADALGINSGEIAEGKNADMIVLDLDGEPGDELAIHLILHRYNISKVYINGKLEKGI